MPIVYHINPTLRNPGRVATAWRQLRRWAHTHLTWLFREIKLG